MSCRGCLYTWLFTPVAVWLYKRECLNHLYLGQLKFNLNNTWGDYMRAMYVPLFLFMGFGALLAVIFAILFGSSDGLNARILCLHYFWHVFDWLYVYLATHRCTYFYYHLE